MKNFTMANSDNPEEIIKATRDAFVASMREVIAGLQRDVGGPGLTWSALEHFLDEFAKKEPTIITQEHEA